MTDLDKIHSGPESGYSAVKTADGGLGEKLPKSVTFCQPSINLSNLDSVALI